MNLAVNFVARTINITILKAEAVITLSSFKYPDSHQRADTFILFNTNKGVPVQWVTRRLWFQPMATKLP